MREERQRRCSFISRPFGLAAFSQSLALQAPHLQPVNSVACALILRKIGSATHRLQMRRRPRLKNVCYSVVRKFLLLISLAAGFLSYCNCYKVLAEKAVKNPIDAERTGARRQILEHALVGEKNWGTGPRTYSVLMDNSEVTTFRVNGYDLRSRSKSEIFRVYKSSLTASVEFTTMAHIASALEPSIYGSEEPPEDIDYQPGRLHGRVVAVFYDRIRDYDKIIEIKSYSSEEAFGGLNENLLLDLHAEGRFNRRLNELPFQLRLINFSFNPSNHFGNMVDRVNSSNEAFSFTSKPLDSDNVVLSGFYREPLGNDFLSDLNVPEFRELPVRITWDSVFTTPTGKLVIIEPFSRP
jgi:hypothetical protein